MAANKSEDSAQTPVEMGVELVMPSGSHAPGCGEPGHAPCPNCAYPKAILDKDGNVWCPACGWATEGRYT